MKHIFILIYAVVLVSCVRTAKLYEAESASLILFNDSTYFFKNRCEIISNFNDPSYDYSEGRYSIENNKIHFQSYLKKKTSLKVFKQSKSNSDSLFISLITGNSVLFGVDVRFDSICRIKRGGNLLELSKENDVLRVNFSNKKKGILSDTISVDLKQGLDIQLYIDTPYWTLFETSSPFSQVGLYSFTNDSMMYSKDSILFLNTSVRYCDSIIEFKVVKNISDNKAEKIMELPFK